jgi:hypothetical protein
MQMSEGKKMQISPADLAGPVPYDVAIPESGLGWEKVGPLFERYSVTLVGRIDEHWCEAYQRIAESEPNLSRFRLDAFSGTVSFTCRASDGPIQVMEVLKILGQMIERVNREASFAAATLSAPARRPTAPSQRPLRAVPSK